MRDPFVFADYLADGFPDRRLRDEIQVRVWIRFPALAFENGPRLAATRCIGGTRHGRAELAVWVLGVLLHDLGAFEPLLVAQLDPAQIEHTVLHRRQHSLTAPGGVSLV